MHPSPIAPSRTRTHTLQGTLGNQPVWCRVNDRKSTLYLRELGRAIATPMDDNLKEHLKEASFKQSEISSRTNAWQMAKIMIILVEIPQQVFSFDDVCELL